MQEPAVPSPSPTTPPKRTLRRKLFYSVLVGVAFLGGIVLVDRLVGWLVPVPTESLLFPSGCRITHDSYEFNVEVQISEAGIRDQDYSPGPPPKDVFRIVTVGDSFTFGWGVEKEEAWPNVLERLLNERSARTESPQAYEVLNFGTPGTSPADYEINARKALHHFAPHLIIVGTLQGDDLIQLQEQADSQEPWPDRALKWLFPTAKRFLKGPGDSSTFVSYQETFQKTQIYIRSQLSPDEKQSYESLGYYVRQCFESGQLNPSLVQRALTTPSHFALPLNGGDEWRRTASERFESSMGQTSNLCQEQQCTLLVAIVPNGPYVSAASAAGMREVGYDVPDDLLTTSIPDKIVTEVCERLSIPCLTQTKQFREQDKELYFPLDGHFNKAGHRLFAENLYEDLIARREQFLSKK